jgi:DNA-binding transcriptional MerR regulator
MELKNTYTTREVAAMTGLTARQLQWWDARRVFASHIPSKKTARGGYTERRYTPVDLLELVVLAELLRQGVSVGQLRRLLDTLREQFGVRLFETIGGGGPLTLLTDGQDVYGRTSNGDLFNMLRDPQQPLLMLSDVEGLRELGATRARGRKHGQVRHKPTRVTGQHGPAQATDEPRPTRATDQRGPTRKRVATKKNGPIG